MDVIPIDKTLKFHILKLRIDLSNPTAKINMLVKKQSGEMGLLHIEMTLLNK